MIEPEPKGWRKWLVIEVAPVIVAGYFMMSIGIGLLVRENARLAATVKEVGALQDAASIRVESLTQALLTWTKWLVVVTVLLVGVTIILLVVTLWPRR